MKVLKFKSPTEATPSTKSLIYNSLDTLMTWRLNNALSLKGPAAQTSSLSHLLLGPALQMMRSGLSIDLKMVEVARADVLLEVQKYESLLKVALKEILGIDKFNPNSGPQKLYLFYDILQCEKRYNRKRGNATLAIDKHALESIKQDERRATYFAALLLKLNSLNTRLKTLEAELTEDGRFLSQYNVVGTETWRWSSSEHPLRLGGNGQNIDRKERRIIRASDDEWYFCYSDLKGAESVMVGAISGDENYYRESTQGDIHSYVAHRVFNIPYDKKLASTLIYAPINDSYRQGCKKAGHSCNYIATAFRIAVDLKISIELATKFMEEYFLSFPGIKEWHQYIRRLLTTTGRVSNSIGDERKFWGRPWDDTTLREAVAFGPQSNIGRLMAIGAYRLWQQHEGKYVQVRGNVHDAVLFQVRKDAFEEYAPKCIAALEVPLDITCIKGVKRPVKVKVEMKYGTRWSEEDMQEFKNVA